MESNPDNPNTDLTDVKGKKLNQDGATRFTKISVNTKKIVVAMM